MLTNNMLFMIYVGTVWSDRGGAMDVRLFYIKPPLYKKDTILQYAVEYLHITE